MSLATIRAALESRLNGIASPLPTAWEAMHYSPTEGTAWQRVRLLLNDPIDHAVTSDVVERRGLLEVVLHYPSGSGSSAAAARAQAIADRFAPVQNLTSGSTTVQINATARIGSGFVFEAWYVVPITVPWVSFTG